MSKGVSVVSNFMKSDVIYGILPCSIVMHLSLLIICDAYFQTISKFQIFFRGAQKKLLGYIFPSSWHDKLLLTVGFCQVENARLNVGKIMHYGNKYFLLTNIIFTAMFV